MSSILHGGRLAATRKDVVIFISSVEEDKRIAQATVLVNEAHVIALAKAKAISPGDARRLIAILREIEKHVPFRRSVEDVHVLIEEHVTKRAGRNVGGQLHLGKSRNDQVATTIRMALRHDMLEISNLLILLERKSFNLPENTRGHCSLATRTFSLRNLSHSLTTFSLSEIHCYETTKE